MTDLLVYWTTPARHESSLEPYTLSVPHMSNPRVTEFLNALSDRFYGHIFSLDENSAICLDGERVQLSYLAASQIINVCKGGDSNDVRRELFRIYVDEIEAQLNGQVH